jgi:hypothetical protein
VAVFADAVRRFWETRREQAAKQKRTGGRDQGKRSEATGGRQMDGFNDVLRDILTKQGVPDECIFSRKGALELPGFFRATKQWDLLVVRDGALLAAIELKSQVGPSFPNNFNNRTEEAIGTAIDTWTAYREGAFAPSAQPWLGYLLLLEDCPESQAPVSVSEPHFPVFPEFKRASYAKRYELFCQKLVRERRYSSACFLLSDRTRAQDAVNYTEPSLELSASQFVHGLLARAACD